MNTLIRLRKKLGLRQEDFADLLGLSRPARITTLKPPITEGYIKKDYSKVDVLNSQVIKTLRVSQQRGLK